LRLQRSSHGCLPPNTPHEPTHVRLLAQVLNAWGNQLQQLPEAFGDLTGLVRLGLKGCQLQQLPPSFTRLTNLVELFLTDNQLSTLPQGVRVCGVSWCESMWLSRALSVQSVLQSQHRVRQCRCATIVPIPQALAR
jgi:hypothetical protein